MTAEYRDRVHSTHVPIRYEQDQSVEQFEYKIRQLADEFQPPESGKHNVVLAEDADAKIILFTFAAGDGLKEHVAPLPAIIQIVTGEAELTVGEETVAGKPGTWIRMAAKTPHSITAISPVIMLLTLLK